MRTKKARRGPWLSGLIVAVIGAVWFIGQVMGGLVTMVTDAIPALPEPAPAGITQPQILHETVDAAAHGTDAPFGQNVKVITPSAITFRKA